MTSETAIEELDAMHEAGLTPTYRDVIRLNALGLMLEMKKNKHAVPVDATTYLPRVAAISPIVSFRQPTIGHEVWLARVCRVVVASDLDTALALKAFALSRPCGELPDPDDPKSVTRAVATYAKELAAFTSDQIYAAISYVVYGADPKRGENQPAESHEPDGSELEDWDYCVSVGVLNEATVALFGVSKAEIERMTRGQVEALIRRSFFFHKIEIDPEIEDAQRDFYRTRDEIVARLKKEKESANG